MKQDILISSKGMHSYTISPGFGPAIIPWVSKPCGSVLILHQRKTAGQSMYYNDGMEPGLSGTELFKGIDDSDIPSLLSCLSAERKEYCKGETILHEGTAAESIGLVLSGMAIISYCDAWGKSSILSHIAPGAVFAEAYACLPGEKLRITVSAAENTEVMFLSIGRILTPCPSGCGFHSAIIRNLLTISAKRNLRLSAKILHTSPKSIRGRLVSYLSECAKQNGSLSFSIPFSRQQLADYLSVDRSALSSEISKMQRDGIIECRKNLFTLKPDRI